MKKKTINRITLFTALGLGAIILISCTANFSSTIDKSNIMYAYDMGSTRYVKTPDELPSKVDPDEAHLTIGDKTFENVYVWQDYSYDYKGGVARTLSHIDSEGVVYPALLSHIEIPDDIYWEEMDKKTLVAAWDMTYQKDEEFKTEHPNQEHITSDPNNVKVDDIVYVLDKYGALKFSGVNEKGKTTTWANWDKWTQELREDPNIGIKKVPNNDFTSLYKSFINNKVNNVRSCITVTGGDYGNFGWNHNTVHMEGKNWGYAWKKGFLEGLLVFPVAYMTEVFAHSFGMGAHNGVAQLCSILLVTFIVRTFLTLVSLKSTIGQQKMQMLQPELARIQAKYPNADTNQAQKQRMSQEQMALYKKNKINPLGTLLVLIVQFPLFIGVWGGLQGSAALATDKFAGLYLSESIWNTLNNTNGLPSNINGWWTAFGLFLIMAVAQFVSMKLPQWMQKAREKKLPKLSANPAQNKTQKQMKWFGYIMLVIIIIMGFTLPAGMGVYWLAGALFSIIQTVITQLAISGTFKRGFQKIKGLFKKKQEVK